MPRSVVHFTDSDAFGGAENAVLTLMAKLDRSRWEPVLAHHRSEGLSPLVEGARSLGVSTWAVPRMPEGALGVRRLPRFVAELRRLDPDLVHLHLTWQFASRYPLLGVTLSRRPALATVQLFVDDAKVIPRVALERRLLNRRVGRYIAVSGHVKARLEGLGWPPRKIQVIPNAVDAASLQRRPDPQLRRNAAGGDAGTVVLVPGRLDAQKGHRYLLRAVEEIPDATFLLAGGGPLREELETLAHTLGITDRVVFLGHRSDIADLLAVSDLVVLPSLYEGLPLAVLEAMAAGRAVITTRVGGVEEVVTEGQNGVLVPPAHPAALAAAIRTLVRDPELSRRLGAAGRQTIEADYDAATMAERVCRVYDAILPDGG